MSDASPFLTPPPEPPVGAAAPRPGLPRTIGVLNLVFGLGLLVCGAGALSAVVPFMREYAPLRADQNLTESALDEMRLQMANELRRLEGSTTDSAEKARLNAARLDLESKPKSLAGTVDFDALNRSLPWLSRYLWAEVTTGPLLNLAMLVAGVGLVLLKEWGRKLAVLVVGLKIVRLVLLNGLLMVMVVPPLTAALDQVSKSEIGGAIIANALDQQNASRAGGPPATALSASDFVQVLGALGYGYALTHLGLGSIYPVVVLVVLTRPGARAACRRAAPDDGFKTAGSAFTA